MNTKSKLLELLLEMEKEAKQGRRKQVLALNLKYSQAYEEVMTSKYSKGSLQEYYVQARNKILNSLGGSIAPTEEDQKRELAQARRIISELEKRTR